MHPGKIIPFADAPGVFAQLRAAGKTLVQCHGTFDLVHPGHIYHLEEAKELGDVLVVTVTAEKFVNKGPGRPYFNDPVRARSLAALACVDYVVLVPHPAAVEAIAAVRPHIYCKGREYENPASDVTGNIRDDVAAVEKHGGQVRYIGSVVFSSTKLLNRHFDLVPAAIKDFCQRLAQEFPPEKFRAAVEDFSKLRVLVVGDIIFDRYSYVKVQGLTSKNRIISGRYLDEETQAGGSLAVYRHIRNFTSKVKLIGLAGTEAGTGETLREFLPPENDLVLREEAFTTIIKQRVCEPPGEGKEVSKLFAVNYIDGEPPERVIQERVLRTLEKHLPECDLVVVADFGHGLMAEEARRLVEAKAPFFALNCQTNSNNHGFNIINQQYRRADCFSLDEQELLLAVARRHISHPQEMENLRARFGAAYAWLTRGAVETIGLREGSPPCSLMPLEARIVDTVGAGDAFFSVAALAAKCGLPNALATFLGQLAGAQAVRIVGNTEPISKSVLLKSGMSLLNY
ncbi:MAG TPA: adenylyltransferase/cytidyltransferase family protein [Opitutales bacterium]|nr:adenylyltransferase/cytidyltransferase family protein [Opitutales bacterium]